MRVECVRVYHMCAAYQFSAIPGDTTRTHIRVVREKYDKD